MAVGVTLRDILRAPGTATLLGVHDPLSALVAQEAGFEALWVSSFTMSCAWGVRDNNELTLDHVLNNVECMTDRVSIPVLLDADTGYGGFNQFRRLVKRLCARGVAGVCIEDKVFPKANSFVHGSLQELVPIDEFCGKLRAGGDARTQDLVLVARTEALIAGAGLTEALKRGRAYVDAGADAILVHSKAPTFEEEVGNFMRCWDLETPVLCVPTTYASTPHETFAAAGIAAVVWANQLLRAALLTLQDTAEHIRSTRGLKGLKWQLAPLEELFRLQDVDEFLSAEARYLPGRSPRAGTGLGSGRSIRSVATRHPRARA